MSRVEMTVSSAELKRLDERAGAVGGSRQSVALAAVLARLDEPIPEPEAEAEAPQPRRRSRNISSSIDQPVEGKEKE